MADILAQALNLCISSVKDVEVLIRLSLVSRTVQGSCKSHVQLHLPMLLESLFEDWERHRRAFNDSKPGVFSLRFNLYKALKWLCQSAGPAAVGSPAAALVVLRMVGSWCNGVYGGDDWWMKMAVQSGMQLTTDTLVAAAKQGIDVNLWWHTAYVKIPDWRAEVQLPPFAALPPQVLAAAQGRVALLAPLLPDITPQQVPGLLHLAVNGRNNWSHVGDVVKELLQHDRQYTHVLHSNNGGSDGSGNDISGNYNTMSGDPTLLVEELLVTSTIRQYPTVVQQLVDTPAAQALTAGAVLKLLYLAVQNELEYRGNHWDPTHPGADGTSTVHAVCRLRAAGSVSATSIYNLMKIAWKQGQYGSVGRLTTLPQAGQLKSSQLCDMVILVCKALLRSATLQRGLAHEYRALRKTKIKENNQKSILEWLTTLQSGQHLAPGDAYGLVKELLYHWKGEPRVTLIMCLSGLLHELKSLNLGAQLTGNELLDLIEIEIKHGKSNHNNNVIWTLLSWKSATYQINNEARYTSILRQFIDLGRHGGNGEGWCHCTRLNSFTNRIPFTKHLGTESVAQLLHACVKAGMVGSFLWQIPAFKQLSAATIGQSFKEAAQKGLLHQLEPLWTIPAAADLATDLFEELVHAVLNYLERKSMYCRPISTAPDLPMLCRLLAMPAAEQLTTDTVAGILSHASTLFSRCSLQGELNRPQGLAGDVIHDTSASVAEQLADLVEKLLHLPTSKQIALNGLVQVMKEAIAAVNTKLVCLFGKVPVIAEMDDSTANQLLQAALEHGDVQVLETLQECLPQIAALAATLHPTVQQLVKQMSSAIASGNEQALAELCKHPKAAEISPVVMAQLLQDMCSGLAKGRWRSDSIAVQLLWETPAAQGLEPSVVADLIQFCTRITSPPFMAGTILVAQLPGAAHIEAKHCEALLDDMTSWIQGTSFQDFDLTAATALQAMECLLQLPKMQAMPAETVARRLRSVMEQMPCDPDGSRGPSWQYVRQGQAVFNLMTKVLPGAQLLSTEHVRALMQLAVEAQDTDTFAWLRRRPTAPTDDEALAWYAFMGVAK